MAKAKPCPKGKTKRKSYRRKDGTRVRATCVKVAKPKAAKRKAAPKVKSKFTMRKATPKAAKQLNEFMRVVFLFPVSQTKGKDQLSRSKLRWNAAIKRGQDPWLATARRLAATTDAAKRASIRQMLKLV